MIVKLKHGFINVNWVKEVTIAAINKSNWINWIKLLLARFIFFIVVVVFLALVCIHCSKVKMTAWLLLIRQQPFETFKSTFFLSISLPLALFVLVVVFFAPFTLIKFNFYIIQWVRFIWALNVIRETETSTKSIRSSTERKENSLVCKW